MPPVSLMWPGHDMTMPCRVPPKKETTCLVHLKRRVEGPRPRHRHVRGGQRRAPDIVELQLFFNRDIDGLNRGHVERRADGGAFGAGAVIAADIDNERV